MEKRPSFLSQILKCLVLLAVSAAFMGVCSLSTTPLLRYSVGQDAAFFQLVYYGIMLIWFPLTTVLLVLTSVWLPMLMAYVTIYPALDQHFQLTLVYEKLQQEQWGGSR